MGQPEQMANCLSTNQETAEQVLCFVKSRGVTGVNAVIDAGWSL